jgi:DNA-directed RNA polymerase subunit RPC12/RpoP
MRKGKVRCFRGYAEINSRYNQEVFFTVPDIYRTRLFTCTVCGEIFFANQEDIDYANQNFDQHISKLKCPTCSSPLIETLKPYPETFVAKAGIGHYQPERIIPPDTESLIEEFWNLYS